MAEMWYVFYVCNRLVGQERCCTLIVSSQWTRKHDDPCATGQKWYCKICEAKYKTTSGMMVQMIYNGQSHFVRASFPTHDLQKIKANCVLGKNTGATTPAELLRAIPEACAQDEAAAITPVAREKGV